MAESAAFFNARGFIYGEIRPLQVKLGTTPRPLCDNLRALQKGGWHAKEGTTWAMFASNCKLRSSEHSWRTDGDTNHALVDSRRYRCVCVCVCDSTGCKPG